MIERLLAVGLIAANIAIILLTLVSRRHTRRLDLLEGKRPRLVIELRNSTGAPIHGVTLNLIHKEPWEGEN